MKSKLLLFCGLSIFLYVMSLLLAPYTFNPNCSISKLKIASEEYRSVQNLLDTGFYEEAKKELTAAIKKIKPSSNNTKKETAQEIPKNWCYLADHGFDPSLGWLEKDISQRKFPIIKHELPSIGQVKSWLMFVLNTIVFIFASIIAISIFKLIFSKRIYLDVKDFNDESIDLKIGKGTTSAIKTLLLESNESGTNYSVNVALDPIEKFESPIETKELTTILKLVNWVFRSTSFFTLSGYYQRSQEKGIGLKLVLKNSREQIFTQDFWELDYAINISKEPTESQDVGLELVLKKEVFTQYFWRQEYVDLKISGEPTESIDPKTSPASTEEVTDIHELLAIPASIWILSELNPPDFKKWLSFNSWESYAYSRVGSYWYLKNNFERSQEMLKKSLLYDSNNRFALFTLGVQKIEKAVDEIREIECDNVLDASAKKLKKAEKILLLDDAKDILEVAKEKAEKIIVEKFPDKLIDSWKKKFKMTVIPVSPVWYKAMFQLLAVNQYKKQIFKDSENCETINKINEFLYKNGGILVMNVENQKHNRKFLDEFEVLAKIIYGSILIDVKPREAKEQIKSIENNRRLVSLKKLGELLLFDFDIKKNNLQNNEHKLVIDYQAYYNLACYYALCIKKHNKDKQHQESIALDVKKDKKTEKYDADKKNMLCYLEYALKQDNSLAKWAEKDPSFEWIRNGSNGSELASDFDRVIKLYTQQVKKL